MTNISKQTEEDCTKHCPSCRAGIARYSISRGIKRAMRLKPIRGLTPYEEIYTSGQRSQNDLG